MKKWYAQAHWKRLRDWQLNREPFCRMCTARGLIDTIATVVDHIVPHRGDWSLFADQNNLQSLCQQCHDKHKQAKETRGWSDEVSIDGFPIDADHPFNGEGGSNR